MTAGYSKTPLVRKLGIKPEFRICLIGAPAHYMDLVGELPDGVVVAELAGHLDFIHYFSTEAEQLASDFPILKKHLDKQGMLWISWPKGKSNIKTDLNGNIVRQTGLDTGLVDIKVCAVDEDWSGLKFVWRKTDR